MKNTSRVTSEPQLTLMCWKIRSCRGEIATGLRLVAISPLHDLIFREQRKNNDARFVRANDLNCILVQVICILAHRCNGHWTKRKLVQGLQTLFGCAEGLRRLRLVIYLIVVHIYFAEYKSTNKSFSLPLPSIRVLLHPVVVLVVVPPQTDL